MKQKTFSDKINKINKPQRDPRWQLGQSHRPHELLNQGPYRDAGDTLGRGKAPDRAKNMAL
jgi:hypothetical protein